MKVGDRIRVFEITQKGANFYKKNIKGICRPEISVCDNETTAQLLSKDILNRDINCFFAIGNHANHVATMVITELK